MAENILLPEEKKYLGKVSRYLGSLGMKYGDINFEMEPDDEQISYGENYFPTHFDNNYFAEIPDGLVPILKRIIFHLEDENLFEELPDGTEIDYQRFEISIDTVKKEISLTHIYSYYDEGDTTGVEYDDMIEEWEEKGFLDDIVPSQVEDWCYQQLEEHFGGWEINEGSQGEFQFDFNQKTLILTHTYNTILDKSNTIWEEEF